MTTFREAIPISIPPPPPPPPPNPSPPHVGHAHQKKENTLKRNMEIIVSYPQLILYEESLFSSPYDVSGWSYYLTEIDSILESLSSHLENQKNKSKPKPYLISNAHDGDALQTFEESSSIENQSNIISYTEIPQAIQSLTKARIMVGERCLSLLPGSYKLWKNHLHFFMNTYINSKQTFKASDFRKIISGFERSLVRLNKMPRIWIMYLQFVREYDYKMDITLLRRLHDRALLALPVTQHEFIWILYKDWITSSLPSIDLSSKLTDQALIDGKKIKNLSITAEETYLFKEYKIRRKWDQIPAETILRALRRYILFKPIGREYFIKVCFALHHFGEGCKILVDLLNEGDDFLSQNGTTPHDLWMDLARICTKYPDETRKAGIDFELIVRAVLKEENEKSIKEKKNINNDDADGDQNDKEQQVIGRTLKWGEMEGALWCKLGDYHIRNGEFELARSVYEEALEKVMTVRDFGMIFDAYANFEEGTIAAMMELMSDDLSGKYSDKDMKQEGRQRIEEGYDSDLDILLSRDSSSSSISTSNAAIELSLARAEHLMERRTLLLNRVLLRQNPNNVGEWLRRAELYSKEQIYSLAIEALEEATTKIEARKAVNGNPAQIWINLANITENHLSVEKARDVYKQVCLQNKYKFKNIDDLAQVHAASIEMELKHDCFENALSLVRQAVADPAPHTSGVAKYLHKSSLRLWYLALDLEESLSDSIQITRNAYERCIHLKVATPTIIMNYAAFLKQNDYFEDSFAAFEKGLDLFPPPHPSSLELWKTYLEYFIERYHGTKIIRTRELFERCLSAPHPPELVSPFFLMYAAFEKDYAVGPSLTKRVLQIYERLCTALPLEKKLQAYQLYISKTSSLLGSTATRSIYEAAIQACNDLDASILCYEYANFEVNLGEIARARAAFVYGSQLVDPRRDLKDYWKKWSDFEISHGDEESFREMLRVKRAVMAAFSTVNYNAAEMGAGAAEVGEKVLKEEEALNMIERREGVKARVLPTIGGFVSGTKRSLGESKVDLEEVEKRTERLRRRVGKYGDGENGNGNGNGNENNRVEEDDDEIDIDDDDIDDHRSNEKNTNCEGKSVNDVKTRSVPAQVFGGLAGAAATMPHESNEKTNAIKKMGALDRLRLAAAANLEG